jgi:hypothetical protein
VPAAVRKARRQHPDEHGDAENPAHRD